MNPAEAHISRGVARGIWGGYEISRGEDPTEQFRKAIEEDFAEALRLNPRFAKAYMSRGLAYLNWGRGHEAQADFERGVKLNSGFESDPYWRRQIEKARRMAKESDY